MTYEILRRDFRLWEFTGGHFIGCLKVKVKVVLENYVGHRKPKEIFGSINFVKKIP